MNKNFSAKQREFIIEFVTSGNLKSTCKNVGISKQTYYNWLNNPYFERDLKKQQEKYYDEGFSKMRHLFVKAVEKQEELLESENESIRLRACNSIIGKNSRIMESYEHRNRLNALEKKVFEQNEMNRMEETINELECKVECKED